jgi:hypothetical protein
LNTPKHQRLLPFEGDKEAKRQERCQRLLANLGDRRITTGARYFDDAAFAEATAIAEESNRRAER